MEFLAPELQAYVDAHCDPEPPLLQELNRETWQKVIAPRMLSGHVQGRILSMIAKMLRPSTVLEVGTYTGYSAICLAEGLAPGGKIYTIEVDPEIAQFAGRYFKKAGLDGTVVQLVGDAAELIATVDAELDFAFIDGKKEQYLDYYHAIMAKLKPGGWILTDNVLWSGQVVDISFTDPATIALREFNSFVMKDERIERVLLPLRDGLFLIRKK